MNVRHKLCYFCGKPAVSRDHCPPKYIYTEPLPNNLNKIPSCKEHNNDCSQQETIFFSTLSCLLSKENYLHCSKQLKHRTNHRIKKKILWNILPQNKKFFIDQVIARPLLSEASPKQYPDALWVDKKDIDPIIEKIVIGLFYTEYHQILTKRRFNISFEGQNNLWQNPALLERYSWVHFKIMQRWVFSYYIKTLFHWAGICYLNFYDDVFFKITFF